MFTYRRGEGTIRGRGVHGMSRDMSRDCHVTYLFLRPLSNLSFTIIRAALVNLRLLMIHESQHESDDFNRRARVFKLFDEF